MNFIKRLYETIIIDDYIQPLTPQYIQTVLTQSKRKRKQSKPKMKVYSNKEQSISSIQSIQATHEQKDDQLQSIFKRIPFEYQIQQVNRIQLELNNRLQKVKRIIVAKSPYYLESIDECLINSEKIVTNSQITKPKLIYLRKSLKKIELSRMKCEKIINLRIKQNNLKTLISYLQKIPNLHNIKLTYLKQVSLEPWLKQLKCNKDIQKFIRNKSEKLYQQLISSLEDIVNNKFQEKRYRDIIIKYIDLQVQTSLQGLLLSVLIKNIRKFDINYFELSQNYINYMTTFLQICIFHKNNTELIDIKDNIIFLCSKIWHTIQDHLVEIVRQTVGLTSVQIFELSCHLNRVIQIGQGFRGLNITEQSQQNNNNYCSKIGQEISNKQKIMFNSTFNKFLISLNQSLNTEQHSQWSRLPVDNRYQHIQLKNTICNLINRTFDQNYIKLVNNDFYYLKKVRSQVIMPNVNETWQLLPYKINLHTLSNYKIKSVQNSIQQIPIQKQVIISQSVLTILKFYEQCSEYIFSLRLTTQNILAVMFFLTNFYLYYIFMSLTPADAKRLFFLKPVGSKQNYQKAKINMKYPSIIKFITTFQQQYIKNGFDKVVKINQSKLEINMVRVRVIALESFDFIVKNLYFCIINLKKIVPGVDKVWQKIQKRFKEYPSLQKQMSELLYSECIYKLTNIQPLLNPLWKTSWLDEYDIQQAFHQCRVSLQLYMKDFLIRLQSEGKGQLSVTSLSEIFILFCKYLSRYIQNKLVRLQKTTFKSKQLFVNMIVALYKQISNNPNYPNYNFTQQIIELVTISNLIEWTQVEDFIRQSVNKCYLSFTGLTALAMNCKASQQLQKKKKEERAKVVDDYIKLIHG